MSMNFDNNINQFKAQAAYKDGGGMGGGGMYFKQKKKKGEEEDDIFQHNEDSDVNENDSLFSETKISEKDIPQDNVFNKFVNWFRANQ